VGQRQDDALAGIQCGLEVFHTVPLHQVQHTLIGRTQPQPGQLGHHGAYGCACRAVLRRAEARSGGLAFKTLAVAA
jgi:hypothetical protein